MPLSAWDKTRVFGTWKTHAGTRIPGTYRVTMPARVTVEAGEAIVPAGLYAAGDLNTNILDAPALDIMVPANDDPDVTPLGWQVRVEVRLAIPGQSAVTENYVIDTPVDGEVNLRTIPLPQTIPPTQTMLLRGVAGGVAALDPDGDVVNAAGEKVIGGEGGSGLPDPSGQDGKILGVVDDSWAPVDPPTGGGAGTVTSVNEVEPEDGNVTLTAADVGARPDDWEPEPPDLSGLVPTSRTVAGKPLTGNVTLDASDVGAATAAQGALAATAVQPSELVSALESKADTSEIPTWGTIDGMPDVIAAGETQAAARAVIGAGTSDLVIGTTGSTAAAGDRAASTSGTGMVELATNAETVTGTDTARAVTPAGVKAVVDEIDAEKVGARPDNWTPGVADIDATGTADETTVLHGDGAWRTPAGGSGLTIKAVLDYEEEPADPEPGDIYLMRPYVEAVFEGLNRTAGATSADQASYVTASHTIAAGDMVIAIFRAQTGASAAASTISGHGLTWTQIGSTLFRSSSDDRLTAWYAIAPSTSSGTITFTPDATATGATWLVRTYTGYDTGGPVSAGVTGDAGTSSASVDASGLTGELTVWVAACNSASEIGVATHAGATLLTEQSHTAPSTAMVVFEKAGESTPGVTWSMSRSWGLVAFKIREAA